MPTQSRSRANYSSRKRRRRVNRKIRLLLTACVTAGLVVGIVLLIGALKPEPDPGYIRPVKFTDITPAPAEPVVQGDPMQQVLAQATEESVTIPEEIYTPEITPEPTPFDDGGYFPEEEPVAAQPDIPVTQTTTTGEARKATLRFIGDVVADKNILATAYNSKTKSYSFKKFFSLVTTQMSNADYTVLNVDGSMGGEKHYKYGYSGYPQFNTPPTLLYALQDAGVDCLTLDNNHCLDGWWEGLKATIANCDYVGMDHIGAYATQEAHDTPEIITVNGIRIGMLNYSQSFNSMDKLGVDPQALEFGVRRTAGADYEGDIRKLRNAGAEIVIVCMHWGEEYLLTPDKDQQSMANRIAKAGADVIVGGHPHTPQAAGWKKVTLDNGETKNVLLFYSLGNFLSEHRNEAKAKTDSGLIVEFTIQENPQTGKLEVVAPKYLPIAVWRVGSEGSYDYRVVGVDDVLKNRPSGMSDSAYARIAQISREMNELFASSPLQHIAY